MPDEEKIQTLPLLALKNSVLFPGLLMPLGVGRKTSVAAVESALALAWCRKAPKRLVAEYDRSR